MTTAFATYNAARDASAGGVTTNIAQIDGLRGVAVAAVVVHHFSRAWLPGGFVGVDIFFVISGFLIGGILWRELTSRGTIDVPHFLLRRLRRLAPAYFVMAAVTTVAAYFILLPFEFREYAKSLIASVVYLSNVQFFREAGYFDIASENKILLHTWSLAVEEQFYLFLPVLLLVFRRSKRMLIGVLAAILVISLVACILVTPLSPTATFFLFPFRAWELLLGVGLAIAWTERRFSGAYGGALSWLGIVLIAVGVALTRPEHDFPGAWALLPTVGTVLLLLNMNDRNPVNSVLSWRPIVMLGLISYSLYLWHWPVLTLASYYHDGEQPSSMVLWLAVAIGLSILSWRFVERPVREARLLSVTTLVSGAGFASAALFLAGFFIYHGDGLPGRYGTATRMHIQASSDFIQDWSRCRIPSDGPFSGIEICPVGVQGEPTFLVWGDSHVRAMKEGIDHAAREAQSAGLLIWRAGCPPLFDVEKQENAATPAQNSACTAANAQIRAALPQLVSVEKVLLIGRWTYYFNGGGTGLDNGNRIVISALQEEGRSQEQIFVDATLATIDEIRKSIPDVYVVEQPPEIPYYDSREAARLLAHGRTLDSMPLVQTMADLQTRSARAEAPFRQLAAEQRIKYLPLVDRFCDGKVCSVVHDGVSFYFDNNHITNTAANAIRSVFAPVVTASSGEAVALHVRP